MITERVVGPVEVYLSALNSGDHFAWGRTLNYPRLRIGVEGEFQVWETQDDCTVFTAGQGDQFADLSGWDHSVVDAIDVIQVAQNAANVAVQISRYNADDEILSTSDALYLVTNENGQWGIPARSSFSPSLEIHARYRRW